MSGWENACLNDWVSEWNIEWETDIVTEWGNCRGITITLS